MDAFVNLNKKLNTEDTIVYTVITELQILIE